MRIFVYEHLTSVAQLNCDIESPSESLRREGLAMVSAVANDLARIDGIQVSTLRARGLSGHDLSRVDVEWVDDHDSLNSAFDRLVAQADAAVVIAPEIDGCLLGWVQRAERLGARLISPDSHFIELTSNKRATAQRLERAHVAVPKTFSPPHRLDQLPGGRLIRKPNRGAGSWQVRWTDRAEVARTLATSPDDCLQEFVPGRPASAAALCGGPSRIWLPPCWQRLEPPDFIYRGGARIRESTLATRARQLAERALAALPPTRGYVGVDLVLGEAKDGRDDVVIEINPRLTTSYVGLREIVRPNLGQAMWQAACGESAHIILTPNALEFDASGTVIQDSKNASTEIAKENG